MALVELEAESGLGPATTAARGLSWTAATAALTAGPCRLTADSGDVLGTAVRGEAPSAEAVCVDGERGKVIAELVSVPAIVRVWVRGDVVGEEEGEEPGDFVRRSGGRLMGNSLAIVGEVG